MLQLLKLLKLFFLVFPSSGIFPESLQGVYSLSKAAFPSEFSGTYFPLSFSFFFHGQLHALCLFSTLTGGLPLIFISLIKLIIQNKQITKSIEFSSGSIPPFLRCILVLLPPFTHQPYYSIQAWVQSKTKYLTQINLFNIYVGHCVEILK